MVQILRYWVKDTSSLHLLRFYLYQSHNWNSLITPKKSSSFFSKRNKRFFFFLYNSHVRESESIFVFLCNQSSHLRSISPLALCFHIENHLHLQMRSCQGSFLLSAKQMMRLLYLRLNPGLARLRTKSTWNG